MESRQLCEKLILESAVDSYNCIYTNNSIEEGETAIRIKINKLGKSYIAISSLRELINDLKAYHENKEDKEYLSDGKELSYIYTRKDREKYYSPCLYCGVRRKEDAPDRQKWVYIADKDYRIHIDCVSNFINRLVQVYDTDKDMFMDVFTDQFCRNI